MELQMNMYLELVLSGEILGYLRVISLLKYQICSKILNFVHHVSWN